MILKEILSSFFQISCPSYLLFQTKCFNFIGNHRKSILTSLISPAANYQLLCSAYNWLSSLALTTGNTFTTHTNSDCILLLSSQVIGEKCSLLILNFKRFSILNFLSNTLESMSSIPLTSFSAIKVHQTIKEQKDRQKAFGLTQPTDISDNKYPGRTHHNYNSKFMNSVWGLYNRYAPQAFQKNEELN